MASIRNKFGEPRFVPGHGVVEAEGTIDVPDGDVYGFTCQEGWAPVGKAGQAVHDAAEKAATTAPEPAPEPDPAAPEATSPAPDAATPNPSGQ